MSTKPEGAGIPANKVAAENSPAQAEKERMMTAMEQVTDAVMITDAEGTIQYVNPAFERMTGYAHGEAVGQNPRILNSGRQDGAFYENLWKTVSNGTSWAGRFVNKRKDGTLYTEEATISPMRDAAGRIVNFVAVKRDITHSLELEERLWESQKMEAVGQLAGGVAHDFNNMLAVILGYTEVLLDGVGLDQQFKNDLREIHKAGRRARDLTRQLLAFARRQVVLPEILDLNAAVEGMLKILPPLIGEGIQVSWHPEAGLWPVNMDPSQIDQILANLCVNARDAIGDTGRITIATENRTIDEGHCVGHAGPVPGEYVLLTVGDDGGGIDREVLAHIFEPFFTTKETGKGTGLGLATVYGIVKQNDGFIDVCSEAGQGTTFKVYLPRHAGMAGSAEAESASEPLPRGDETILLVEDEPTFLKVAATMLEKQGYTVLSANSPSEAFRLAREYSGKIHLLTTDMVMPEMNGRDLAQKLLFLYPQVKCLFMSGYTVDIVARNGVLEAGTHFIQKPFSTNDLALKVRETLDVA
jgi:PAS domain S-box-containing protein